MASSEFIEDRGNSIRVKIPYYNENGDRLFYSKSFSIKKYGTKKRAIEEAKKHRDQVKLQVVNNQIIKRKKYSLDDVYKEQMELYNATVSTKKKVEGTYNKYIKSYIGGERDFSNIKFDDIQKNLNNMVSIAKDDTIQRARAIWGRLYKYAVAKDIVLKDETYNVHTPKSDILTITKGMDISDNDFLECIEMIDKRMKESKEKNLVIGSLLIMRYEGMRPSEVFALTKSNVDLDNMMIYICQRIGSSSTEFNVVTHAKTESSIRYIPIDVRVYPVFKKLIEMSDSEYLFKKSNGDFMNGTYLSDKCRLYTNNKLRPYMLRHQFSTDLLLQGTDIRTIQELMGHTSATMTIGYARSNDDLKRKALDSRIIA